MPGKDLHLAGLFFKCACTVEECQLCVYSEFFRLSLHLFRSPLCALTIKCSSASTYSATSQLVNNAAVPALRDSHSPCICEMFPSPGASVKNSV